MPWHIPQVINNLLITPVKIRFITTTLFLLFFAISVVNLIHQVSDKRLLSRCGTGESYLTEIYFGSFRPSGLRSKRAEA